MAEKITVQARSEIITAQSGRKYFTVTDDTQRKLICFNPDLYELLPLGATVKDVDIQAGKSADDTPNIRSITVDGQMIGGKTGQRQQYKGRDEGRTDTRTAILEIGEDWRVGKRKDNDPLVLIREAWLADKLNTGGQYEKKQSVTQTKPDTQAPVVEKVSADETGQPPVSKPIIGEAKTTSGITVDELYQWIAKNMKWKSPTAARSFIVNKMKIAEARIDTDPQGVKDEIKQLQNWED